MSSVDSPTMGYYSEEEWEEMCKKVKIRKEDMNELVMNFLVKEGYATAAEKFFQETGTLPTKNFQKIPELVSVVKAILCHDIDGAFKVVETSHPEAIVSNLGLFISLGKLHCRELMHKGKDASAEAAASCFYQDHLAPFVESNPSSAEDWSKFVRQCGEGYFNGPVGSNVEEWQLVKMVIQELKPICVTADLDEKKDSKITTLLKMVKNAQNELDDYCYYPHLDVE